MSRAWIMAVVLAVLSSIGCGGSGGDGGDGEDTCPPGTTLTASGAGLVDTIVVTITPAS